MARSHVLSLAVCCMLAASAAAAWVPGIATFTGEASAKSAPNAACGYGPIAANELPPGVLALAGVSFSKSILGKHALKGCGVCVQLKCTDKACSNTSPRIVMINDDCDGCEANQFTMQATPFARMANPDVGRVTIEYQEVPCTFVGGITLHVHKFRTSGGGFVKVAFKNVNGSPLVKAEIAAAGSGNFSPMRNTYGAVFEASRLPPGPLDVKLTNTEGQSLILAKALTSDQTGNFQTTKNF